MSDPRMIEPVESRLLLSIAAAAFSETNLPAVGTIERSGETVTEVINWDGRAMRMVQGRWIVSLPGVKGAGAGRQVRGATALLSAAGLEGFSVERQLGAKGLFAVSAPAGLTPAAALQALHSLPGSQLVEPDLLYYADALPNDPQFNTMWGLRNTGQSGGVAGIDINAPSAWDLTTGNGTQIVGIIDSGVDYTHPDLAANIFVNPGEIAGNGMDDDANGYVDDVNGYNFLQSNNDPMDVRGHGTHVAGTVGAVGNNGVGVSGVSWNVKILPLKVGGATSADNSINLTAAVQALNYVALMKSRGFDIRVTNNSWGGPGVSGALQSAIGSNQVANIMFVCAAGNDGLNIDTGDGARYPAAYAAPNIISVANITRTGAISSSSNFGSIGVDLGAPGTTIRSTTPGNTYSDFTGTSMASPHVAGAAALLFSTKPNASYQDVKNAILTSATPTPSMQGVTVSGGRLNLRGALDLLAILPESPATPTLDSGSDTGVLANDGITNDNTPTFRGFGQAGATITLVVDDQPSGQVIAAGDGSWSITPATPLLDGLHNIAATATNPNGVSGASNPLFVKVDTVRPSAGNGGFVWASAPHAVTFLLSEDVQQSLGLADLTVVDTATGQPLAGASLAYDVPSNTARVTFPGLSGGLVGAGNFRLTVQAAGVADPAGNVLSGDFNFDFFFLPGDANRDRRVDIGDFGALASNFNRSPRNYGQGDFDYSGTVNIDDFAILAGRFNTSLPAGRASGLPFGTGAIGVDGPEQDTDSAMREVLGGL